MKYKNFKVLLPLFLITTIILILLVVAFFFNKGKNPIYQDSNIEQQVSTILGNKDDLVFFSIVPGAIVSDVVSLAGEVKGGYFFEANILINVLDINQNVLKKGYGTATTDWMTAGPVSFTANVDFTGLIPGPAYIEIQNDDPSDGEAGPAKKILIPIIIQ